MLTKGGDIIFQWELPWKQKHLPLDRATWSSFLSRGAAAWPSGETPHGMGAQVLKSSVKTTDRRPNSGIGWKTVSVTEQKEQKWQTSLARFDI